LDSDKKILKSLQSDDPGTIQHLFDHYYQALFVSAIRMVGIREIAEEIVDDVFVNLWNKRKSLQIEKDIESYLYASVRYGVLNYYRSQKGNIFKDIELVQESGTEVGPLEEIYGKELERALEKAMDVLPEKCRAETQAFPTKKLQNS
jgi:RNA polymerase sigma-70 factor (ECF subfamily)